MFQDIFKTLNLYRPYLGLCLLLFFAVSLSGCKKQNEPTEYWSHGITEITEDDYYNIFYGSREDPHWDYKGMLPAIVTFYIPGCPHCLALRPMMVQITKDYKGKVLFYSINAKNAVPLYKSKGIKKVPTVEFVSTNGTAKTIQKEDWTIEELRDGIESIL